MRCGPSGATLARAATVAAPTCGRVAADEHIHAPRSTSTLTPGFSPTRPGPPISGADVSPATAPDPAAPSRSERAAGRRLPRPRTHQPVAWVARLNCAVANRRRRASQCSRKSRTSYSRFLTHPKSAIGKPHPVRRRCSPSATERRARHSPSCRTECARHPVTTTALRRDSGDRW